MSGADLSIYLVGDVRVENDDPAETFALCAGELRRADILFGNLESVISDRWDPADVSDLRLVGTPERMLAGYGAAGFTVLNVANNPSMRFGWPALARCLELLDGAGIAHIGAGLNMDEARRGDGPRACGPQGPAGRQPLSRRYRLSTAEPLLRGARGAADHHHDA